MPVKRLFTSHPASVGETYSQHFGQAMSFSAAMLGGAICCAVHAFLPFLCEKTGSKIITNLHDRMVLNRSRLSPQTESSQAQFSPPQPTTTTVEASATE